MDFMSFTFTNLKPKLVDMFNDTSRNIDDLHTNDIS